MMMSTTVPPQRLGGNEIFQGLPNFEKQIGKICPIFQSLRKVAKFHSRLIFIDLPAEIAIKKVNSEFAQIFKQMNIRIFAFPNAVRYENNYWAKCCPSVAAVRYMILASRIAI
jgi:hypothetical protein